MMRRQAVIDASSAIILCKAGLHLFLVDMYDVIMPESVYREITVNPYKGSDEYARLAESHAVRVHNRLGRKDNSELSGLGKGERDVIRLYSSGAGDFIITDDGRAARYCQQAGIPFINGLLIPAILRWAGLTDEGGCRELMDTIIAAGRYSKQVTAFARQCRKADIIFAMP